MNILKKKWVKKSFKVVAVLLICIILFTGANHFTQHFIAHKKPNFVPEYDKVKLTTNTDLKTIFLQTGIGEKTAEKMIKDGRFNEILEAQEDFFGFYDVECNPMIKWFTREERLKDESYRLYDLQPGDIQHILGVGGMVMPVLYMMSFRLLKVLQLVLILQKRIFFIGRIMPVLRFYV